MRLHLTRKLTAVVFAIVFLCAATGNASLVTIDFDAIDTGGAGGSVGGATLDTYLAGFGVSIGDVQAGTEVRVFDPSSGFPVAPSVPNVLTHFTSSSFGIRYYELDFDVPLTSLSFTRSGLVGSDRHPAWNVTAIDSLGNTVDFVSEAQFSFSGTVLPKTFTVAGADISSLRVETNYQGEIFNSIFLDDFVLAPIPEPTTFIVWSLLGLSAVVVKSRRNRQA